MGTPTAIQTTVEPGGLQKSIPPHMFQIGKKKLPVSGQSKKVLLSLMPSGEWQADEIATLGESDVFVRRDATGQLMLIHKAVRLSAAKKEIARLGKKDDDPWVITVAGYNTLNQFAGVYISTPDVLMSEGVAHSNPYVQYSASGEIKRVIARKIAIGFSPTGNIVAVDTVRHYNFEAYYLQDLQNKAKYIKDAARFGTSFMCPFASDEDVQEKSGSFYVRKDGKVYLFKRVMDNEGIWIDMSHNEIGDVYSQHIQHQKFGDVIAQNLAARNALKAHPAIATTQVIPVNGVAEVRVFGYRHGMNEEKIREIAQKIIYGETLDGVQVRQDIGEASFEEERELGGEEIDDSEAPKSAGPASGNSSNGDWTFPEKNVTAADPQQPAKPDDQEPTIQMKIQEIALKKGFDLNRICKNMFNPDSNFASLKDDEYARLLSMVEKTPSNKVNGNGGK